MKDSTDLIQRAVLEISRSQKDSPTEVGQTKDNSQTGSAQTTNYDLIDTINQIFSLFSINYHNQFYAAFTDENTEAQAKKLWLETLKNFPCQTLLLAANIAIKKSDFLPTLHKMLQYCLQAQESTLPDAHTAYVEACNARHPKQNQSWTHPIVYFAGKHSNWHFLATQEESKTFPVFKRHYEDLCEQLAQGCTLPKIEAHPLPENVETFLTKDENAERMKTLKRSLGWDDIT